MVIDRIGVCSNVNGQSNLVRLTNVGAGVAMNVRGVVFGPEPTMPQGMPPAIHSLSAAAPMPPGQPLPVVAKRGFSGLKVQGTDSFVPGYTLYAPAAEQLTPGESSGIVGSASPVQFRLTLTYHDLFGRIHGSVYDYTGTNGWEAREPARQITMDWTARSVVRDIKDPEVGYCVVEQVKNL